jgi:hypothetical protein
MPALPTGQIGSGTPLYYTLNEAVA